MLIEKNKIEGFTSVVNWPGWDHSLYGFVEWQRTLDPVTLPCSVGGRPFRFVTGWVQV